MLNALFFDSALRQQSDAKVYPQKYGLLIHANGRELFWKHREIKRSNAGYPGHLILKHGDAYQPDTLDFKEAEFTSYLKQHGIRVGYLPLQPGTVVKRVALAVLVGALLFIGLLIAAWFLLLPKLTAALAQKVPRSIEHKLSGPMLQSLLASEKIDTARTAAINGFYRQFAIPVEVPVHITVVNSDVVNALAVPGGELVVYNGLLKRLEQPGQLVALLGHEAGHVQYRHSLLSLMRNVSGHLVLAVLLQDAGVVADVLLTRAKDLEQLAYSRDLELEADRFGLQTLNRNGYQSAEMAALMNHLKEANGDYVLPDFMSTHPAADERIELAKEWKNSGKTAAAHTPNADSVQHFWKLVKADF